MPDDNTVTNKAARARRARYEDIEKLERRIEQLEVALQAKPVDQLGMPMTKELFMGLAALAMLSGGEMNQLKYLHQQVPFAYEQWARAVEQSRELAAAAEPVTS